MLVTKSLPISIVFDDNNPLLCSPRCLHFKEGEDKEAECRFYNIDLDLYDHRYRRESDCMDDFGITGASIETRKETRFVGARV